jgi:hypothetical protein
VIEFPRLQTTARTREEAEQLWAEEKKHTRIPDPIIRKVEGYLVAAELFEAEANLWEDNPAFKKECLDRAAKLRRTHLARMNEIDRVAWFRTQPTNMRSPI